MISVVFGVDSKYSKYCAVTIVSILSNHKALTSEDKIKFYFLSPERNKILQKDKDKILNLKKIQDFDCEFIDIPDEEYTKLPPHSRKISYGTYSRLFISKFLPQDLNKTIYLDSDIIVTGDIKKLFDYNIDNYLLAAVRDYSRRNQDKDYFNAGVLLLNLRALREFNFYEKWKKFVNDLEDVKILTFFDQDILNEIAKGKVLLLPKEFNAMPVYAANNCENVVIAHFTSFKPWEALCIHPMQNLYWQYVKQADINIKKQGVFSYLVGFIRKEPLFFVKPKYWKLIFNLVKDKITVFFK